MRKVIASSVLFGFLALSVIVGLPESAEAARVCKWENKRNRWTGKLQRTRVCDNVSNSTTSGPSTSSANTRSTSSANTRSTSSANRRN